jgi:uncharacterized protein (UPF0333 family)
MKVKENNGQTLIEFLLVFVVLLTVTSYVFVIYKKFWKEKYNKVSASSGALSAILKTSKVVSYVK